MTVTEDDVKRVSHLARIRIDDSRIQEIQNSLSNILRFVAQLNEVDCSQVDDAIQYITSLHEREDVVIDGNTGIMDNAPIKECNMFIVPKVVG
ncbi:MAG: Asp-tRNA(Asn)/Glu-tRNA(Gln) amidotransferase subunit GatC [Holosporaceae bacterium]|jgi:aspartyl-tRNA(Asn)/glutamyl-tRNA(Gln) amidotransferase subunit C|nr:Asp-tRNA(Asn)/Glu-tRNA(Gln) amidotransferase subunit GatC [Holosporaceae bacterium]